MIIDINSLGEFDLDTRIKPTNVIGNTLCFSNVEGRESCFNAFCSHGLTSIIVEMDYVTGKIHKTMCHKESNPCEGCLLNPKSIFK